MRQIDLLIFIVIVSMATIWFLVPTIYDIWIDKATLNMAYSLGYFLGFIIGALWGILIYLWCRNGGK